MQHWDLWTLHVGDGLASIGLEARHMRALRTGREREVAGAGLDCPLRQLSRRARRGGEPPLAVAMNSSKRLLFSNCSVPGTERLSNRC